MPCPTQKYRIGDCVKLMGEMPAESVDLVFTSPPYWQQRDYKIDGQLGLEQTIGEYVDNLLRATKEIMRVLKSSGVFCLNIGDTYYGSGGAGGDYMNGGLREGQPKYKQTKSDDYIPKCMCGIPERVMLGCIDQGFILRDKIVWAKKVWFAKTNKTIGNCMPGSQNDRCTFSYEPIYMFTKQPNYWSDMDSIRTPYISKPHAPCNKSKVDLTHHFDEPTRIWGGRRGTLGATSPNVWQINTKPYTSGLEDVDHFAAFPPELATRIINAFCPAEVCPVCGMARERITEKEVEFTSGSGKAGNLPKGKYEGSVQAESGTYDIRVGPKVTHHTVGWTSCNCDAVWVAGTVLDPFAGSGTVGEAARKLNRNAILFDLNPDYGRLISERIMEHTPPLSAYCTEDE